MVAVVLACFGVWEIFFAKLTRPSIPTYKLALWYRYATIVLWMGLLAVTYKAQQYRLELRSQLAACR